MPASKPIILPTLEELLAITGGIKSTVPLEPVDPVYPAGHWKQVNGDVHHTLHTFADWAFRQAPQVPSK